MAKKSEPVEDGIPGHGRNTGDLFGVLAHAQGQELAVVEDRDGVAFFADLLVQGFLDVVQVHEAGDAGGDDEVGPGFVDNGVQGFLDESVGLGGRIVGEAACAAAAGVFSGEVVHFRAQGRSQFFQGHGLAG